MLTTNAVELLEKSSVKLKITIPEAEIKKEYNDLVKKYCSSVQIKGFRKGKVPPDILIRKFGDALKDETAQNLMQKSLEENLEKVEHKPLPYCHPQMVDNESKLELDKDFSFEITYDTFPKIELGTYTNLDVEEPVVKIVDEDMQRELKILQEQNALVVEKKDPVVAKDDIVTLDYIELDTEGKEKEDTRRESFTFTVGSGYNLYKFDDDIIGMKPAEEKVIEKEFPADYQYPSLAGKKVQIKIKVTTVKEKEIPALDDDLAQDISEKYKTLADLKADIQKRLEESVENKIREDKIAQLIEKVVKASTIDPPESMIQQELEYKWQSMLYRFGTNEQILLKELANQNKDKEKLFSEWRQAAEESIKSELVVEKMVELEKIETSEEEVEDELKKMAEAQNTTLEKVKETYTNNGMLASIKLNIRNQKLFTHLLKSTNIKKGKKVKYIDYMQGTK